MKSHQYYQATVLLSYLGVFSFTAANPLPENSYGSDLDSVNMFNGDDPGSPDINWDDTNVWGSDQGNQMLSFDPASTVLSDSNPIDGSLIAYGDKLKAPYCGTTEQPVCCSQISESGFSGCRYCKASPIRPCLCQCKHYQRKHPISSTEIFTELILKMQSTQAISKTAKDLTRHAVIASSR